MDKATGIHILLSGVLAAVSISALLFGWNGHVSGAAVILVKLYLIAILFEAFQRSEGERKIKDGILLAKPTYLFPFPSKTWTGLLILFMVSALISGFANMYIYSGEVVYAGPVVENTYLGVGDNVIAATPSVLKDKIDALYFSLVTMITLGFGEFLPISTYARFLVMWQLTAGGLLVIGIFPLIVSRVADF